ncbi:MAG: porin [Paludibacteraceae bacterium]
MRRFAIYLFMMVVVVWSQRVVALDTDSIKYKPNIEGTIRAKYEYNTSLDAHRFQVRNARFSVNGRLNPVIYYKAEIDLSDEGDTRMLDAFIRYQPINWFKFTIGQQKIPFSTDNLRSPHQLYFANRSFIGKQLTGLRDVGATALFSNKRMIPFNISIGTYNGDGLYEQQNWKTNNMSFASRVEVFPSENIELSLNYNSVKPESIRMNMVDIGCYFNFYGFHLESEYFYKTYEKNAFKSTIGLFALGAYDIEIGVPYLQKITPLVRYDMMTDNNKGYANSLGLFVTDHIARSRITSGVTFSLGKPFLSDIRLNYENYFYKKQVTNIDNKLVLEFVTRF